MLSRERSFTTQMYICILYICIIYYIAQASYLDKIFLFLPVDLLSDFCQYCVPIILSSFLLLDLLQRRTSARIYVYFFLVLCFLSIQFFYIHNSTILNSFLFVICYPLSLKPKRLAEKIWPAYAVPIAYIIICSQLGLIHNKVTIRGGTDNIRMALGFVSANALANTVAITYIIYAYSKIDKWKKHDSVIAIFCAIILYMFTNSRFSTLIIFSIACIGVFYKKIRNKNITFFAYKVTSFLFIICFFVCYFITVVLGKQIGSSLYIWINQIFSTRPRWMIYYYNEYGFSLFGQPIQLVGMRETFENGASWMGLDNAYMMIPIHYGFLCLIMFIFIFYFLGSALREQRDLFGALICIILIFQGLTENYLISIQYNFALFLFAYYFLSSKSVINLKESIQI